MPELDEVELCSTATERTPWLDDDGASSPSTHGEESDDTLVEDWDRISKWRRPSIFWLLPPTLLLTVAFGGVMVPKINLTVDLICRSYFEEKSRLDPDATFAPVVLGGENGQCHIPEVQQKVATFRLAIGLLTGTLSAFAVSKIGSLSDRYGRIRLLVLVSSGGAVSEAIAILAAQFPDVVHFNWLLLGAFFDGLAGSFTAASVLVNSYVSDCTPPAKRAVYTGYLYACISMGWAFGPLIASYLVNLAGSTLPLFYITLGCHLTFMLFIWTVTPESVSMKSQLLARARHQTDKAASARKGQDKIARPQKSGSGWCQITLFKFNPIAFFMDIFESLKILAPAGPGQSRVKRNLILLALIDTATMAVYMNSDTVTILYLEAFFKWGTFESSQYVSILSFAEVIILLTVLPAVDYLFRRQSPRSLHRRQGSLEKVGANAGADKVDLWLMRAALSLELTGVVGYIISRSPKLFYMFGIVASFGGLRGAVIKSILTKHVPEERVGSLLGALGLLQTVGQILAPLLFNGVYAATVDSYPQAIFVLLAGILGPMALSSLFVKPHVYLKEEEYELVPQLAAGNRNSQES